MAVGALFMQDDIKKLGVGWGGVGAPLQLLLPQQARDLRAEGLCGWVYGVVVWVSGWGEVGIIYPTSFSRGEGLQFFGGDAYLGEVDDRALGAGDSHQGHHVVPERAHLPARQARLDHLAGQRMHRACGAMGGWGGGARVAAVVHARAYISGNDLQELEANLKEKGGSGRKERAREDASDTFMPSTGHLRNMDSKSNACLEKCKE